MTPAAKAPTTVAIVQAHSRGWEGSKDYSLYEVDGHPVIWHAIGRLLQTDGITAENTIIAVPDLPENDVYEAVASETGVQLFRGSVHNVLARLAAAGRSLKADRLLHVMGQHMFLNPELLTLLLTRQADTGSDLFQAPINLEPKFTGIVVTVDTLARAEKQINALPSAERERMLARPLSYIFDHTDRFAVGILPEAEVPRYSDDELRSFRKTAKQIYRDERAVLDRSSAFLPGNYHQQRYLFALPFVSPHDDVLDVACGAGYGTAMLAEKCKKMVGADLDAETIAEAKKLFMDKDNIEFVVGDACKLDVPDDSFDVITSMETIEHVPDPDDFCREMARVLRPGGVFICTTPQSLDGRIPVNPFHIREFSLEAYRELLANYFTVERIRGSVNGVITDGELGNNMIAVLRPK